MLILLLSVKSPGSLTADLSINGKLSPPILQFSVLNVSWGENIHPLNITVHCTKFIQILPQCLLLLFCPLKELPSVSQNVFYGTLLREVHRCPKGGKGPRITSLETVGETALVLSPYGAKVHCEFLGRRVHVQIYFTSNTFLRNTYEHLTKHSEYMEYNGKCFSPSGNWKLHI